jgi:hypothetical protein
MPDTSEPADRVPIDGADITVTIRRPVGKVSVDLRIDEMVWSGRGAQFREGAVLYAVRAGAHACLKELLTAEGRDSEIDG